MMHAATSKVENPAQGSSCKLKFVHGENQPTQSCAAVIAVTAVNSIRTSLHNLQLVQSPEQLALFTPDPTDQGMFNTIDTFALSWLPHSPGGGTYPR